jgi:hypothetical protein
MVSMVPRYTSTVKARSAGARDHSISTRSAHGFRAVCMGGSDEAPGL